jgi:hypothetical protein
MKNRSTVRNLLKYTSFVLNSIEERWQVDSVYTVEYTPSTVTGGDVCGYRTCSMIMAKVLFYRKNSKDKNR